MLSYNYSKNEKLVALQLCYHGYIYPSFVGQMVSIFTKKHTISVQKFNLIKWCYKSLSKPQSTTFYLLNYTIIVQKA